VSSRPARAGRQAVTSAVTSAVTDLVGEDVLMYASDYPHWDGDEPGYFERRLPESWRQGVMHDNAVQFYGNRLNLPIAK
jgi:predicted TIM-barrel fold metal-dependent hydrolase